MRELIRRVGLGFLSTSLLVLPAHTQSTAPETLNQNEPRTQLGVSDPKLQFAQVYREGLLLLRSGSFKAAQVDLSTLCRTEMQSAEVLQNLGLAFLRISPKQGLQKGAPGAEIANRVGHAACLAAQKKYDEARQAYSSLVQKYPNYPYIHYAFGRFCADMDDVPAAIGEFKRELQNYPNDINSRLEIAASEYKLDSGAGVPYAEEAVKLNPHVPSAHYLLGLLYLDTDNYRKAIPELEIAHRALPKDAKICFALGSAYAQAGRKDDAARARAEFVELNKESNTTPLTPH